jgi:uncharacterized membrane protein
VHAPAKPRARIESLADLIFGLALSVGAISLVSNPPTTSAEVQGDLATFGFSFLILITMWLRYTRIMSVFPLDSPRVIRLNIVLLFCVSVEPFLFNLVRHPANTVGFAATTSSFYALDLGAMFLIMGGFTLTLASEERNLVPKEMMREFRVSGWGWFVCGALFLVSAMPIFYTTSIGTLGPIRYYFWAAPLVLIWALRRQSGWDTAEG